MILCGLHDYFSAALSIEVCISFLIQKANCSELPNALSGCGKHDYIPTDCGLQFLERHILRGSEVI